jgi:uncharacterized membrane-anchored protein YjiN (DUF445 family)
MAPRERIGRIAVASLGLALALVFAGKAIEFTHVAPFLGGLVAAFGEAALVGGLADWFAVRALFAHPFGIPFPHTAIIPRNRKRLTAEIRKLVVNEWLPREVLVQKVEAFDFVGQAILPAVPTMRPHLRDLLRNAVREMLGKVEPRKLAEWVAGGVSDGVGPTDVAPWVAELVRHAREKNWLEPLLRELVQRLETWASSPECRKFIKQRLESAADVYRQRGSWQDLILTIGEISGGVDLAKATGAVQGELVRFASEQMDDDSQMQVMLREGMLNVEGRLRDDPNFLDGLAGALKESDTLASLLERILTSLRDEALARVDSDDSPWLDLAMQQADAWLARLTGDKESRKRVNRWCRDFAAAQLEQHHAIIGVLVEEQMNRLSDDALTQLIEKRVGEDLNWIRLNGTFVGGLIGVALYLLVELIRWRVSP